jgi:predicted transcriptional regulator of viral defense system
MGSKFDTTAWMAERQHGRVAWWQLVAEGIDRHTVQRWLEDGRLRRAHHGVYAVGHKAPSLHGDLMAAVLACGEGAVLSYRSAAHLLGLVRSRPPRPEVTVPTTAGRRRPGIAVHRVKNLPPLDASTLDRIPVTTVPRTLLDLAPSTGARDLARACHEAWVRHRTGPDEVEACLARNPNKKGAAKLRRALGADVTLSALEDRFLAMLRRHDLPLPRTNVDHAGDKVDCHWPQLGLTVELLSYRFHATRRAFEADVARRRRSNHLAYTYGDVFERDAATAAELRLRLYRM